MNSYDSRKFNLKAYYKLDLFNFEDSKDIKNDDKLKDNGLLTKFLFELALKAEHRLTILWQTLCLNFK